MLDTVAGHAKVDYGFHLAPMTVRARQRDSAGSPTDMGVTSFKYYMFYKGLNLAADSRDAAGYTMADEYDLGICSRSWRPPPAPPLPPGGGYRCRLHCEQPELLRVFIERAKADPALSGLRSTRPGARH